jgi:hypothetical protein
MSLGFRSGFGLGVLFGAAVMLAFVAWLAMWGHLLTPP